MAQIIKPDGYNSLLDLKETQIAIKATKDCFQNNLARELKLTRVSAPLFVDSRSGLNDDLNGSERAVAFDVRETGCVMQIVHSLAKWKRYALKEYGFKCGEGLYTDMNAIRRDEDTDNIHSIYVDQWDWEKVIDKTQRNVETLMDTVKKIYSVFKTTEEFVHSKYPEILPRLPEEIKFITTQELEDMYPELSGKEREHQISKKYGAVFIMQIGGVLKSGQRHDGRAPDYDDWELNGDIVFYDDILDIPFEVSSMGIRVSEESMRRQLKIANCEDRAELPFHKDLLEGKLPYTIGGGIGQSRICMYILRKAHIGEVQASAWPEEMRLECSQNGIKLL